MNYDRNAGKWLQKRKFIERKRIWNSVKRDACEINPRCIKDGRGEIMPWIHWNKRPLWFIEERL